MSTAPDAPASIPEHLLDTITDGMDFRDDQGWIPWAWGVLARAGDVPTQIDEDDPDYPRSLMTLAALGRLYDLFQQVLSGLSADLETNPDLVGEVRPGITTIELARYSEAEGVFDTAWPETGSGLLREAIRTRTEQISARGLTPFCRSSRYESRPVARGRGQGDWSDHDEQQEASHPGAGRP